MADFEQAMLPYTHDPSHARASTEDMTFPRIKLSHRRLLQGFYEQRLHKRANPLT